MNFNQSNPIYLQIAVKVCDGVLGGQYTVGQRIPSVREMAVAIEVNPNTVQRTYTTLQEWGIVEMRRGRAISPPRLHWPERGRGGSGASSRKRFPASSNT